jgi:hypothetical protein
MKAKPGELKFGWSKGKNDLVYAWGGDGAFRWDAALLHSIMSYPLRTEKSLHDELIERGYDITTIKFSIQKKRSTI